MKPAPADDKQDKPEKVAKVAKATRPQGRYKKREWGKAVKGYSSKDLEGILVSKAKSPEIILPEEVTEEAKSDIHVEEIEQVIPLDWWGHKLGYIGGGFLGAESRRRKSLQAEKPNERTMFNEDDQENLYNLVQDKATSGKQGLGIKDRPKKVAGCYFEGKKTTFGDSDGEDSSDSRSSLKRKHDENLDTEMAEMKPKLKKLCRRLLQQLPGETLKLKQLKLLVDEHSPSTFSNCSPEEAIAILKCKLEKSDRFSVKGKKILLSKRS